MFSLWIPLNGFRKIHSCAERYTVAPVEIHSRFLRFFSSRGYNFALLFVISYNYERVVLSVIIILVVEWTVGLQDAVRHFTQIFLEFIVKKYLSDQTKKSIITLYCLERVLEGFTTCSLMNFCSFWQSSYCLPRSLA